MSDPRPRRAEPSLPRLTLKAASLAAAAGGLYLVAGPRPSLEGGILLLVVALAAAAVLLGSGSYGPDVEGALDLSARLGLGLLGGTLGALVSVAVRWLLVGWDVPDGFGVRLATGWTSGELLAHLGSGAVWGLVLGVLYPRLPGRGPGARGAWFSLLPSLYLLLKVYPLDRDLGFFGSGLGTWTFLFVLFLNLVWGVIAGSTIGWGEIAEEPAARPIDE